MFSKTNEITRLENDLLKWKSLLASVLMKTTGQVDKEKEALYWSTIREIQKQIEELNSRTVSAIRAGAAGFPDGQGVYGRSARETGLLSIGIRNRFMKCPD